ncbi:MAG: hypothetical protein QF486_02610 [Candidatus Woesearchaeota archaeon]|jgi:hypothetical protein|nr:hypothetical protein [Candidatus Woesearchaeota archaeon]MDP7198487.1 hypothetical protein [Candidatus Woesearchaeota archaeon]MDP7466771.1 hypothetical protein [Candidatus Woesearchaeota archaeon]MDP7647996.1 hypothetical protein [Candidatus Woesearchaeota archaeon]|tara:strand:- start:610 stop:846 length:237 start_codon:yes stop_codon:yes gene_type:complete
MNGTMAGNLGVFGNLGVVRQYVETAYERREKQLRAREDIQKFIRDKVDTNWRGRDRDDVVSPRPENSSGVSGDYEVVN